MDSVNHPCVLPNTSKTHLMQMSKRYLSQALNTSKTIGLAMTRTAVSTKVGMAIWNKWGQMLQKQTIIKKCKRMLYNKSMT